MASSILSSPAAKVKTRLPPEFKDIRISSRLSPPAVCLSNSPEKWKYSKFREKTTKQKILIWQLSIRGVKVCKIRLTRSPIHCVLWQRFIILIPLYNGIFTNGKSYPKCTSGTRTRCVILVQVSASPRWRRTRTRWRRILRSIAGQPVPVMLLTSPEDWLMTSLAGDLTTLDWLLEIDSFSARTSLALLASKCWLMFVLA